MEFLSKEFWNDLYQVGGMGWDMGQVSPPLKAWFDQLEDKSIRILIPGCGNSYEAEYLMKQGFRDVTVIDIAETPVARLKEQLSEYDNKEIEIIYGDFFEFEFQTNFDLIIEQTFFCAIDRSLRPAFASRMHDLLSDNGKLVGVLFKTEFDKPGPPFGGTKEEYEVLFSKYFNILKMEDCYNSHPKRQGNELFISLSK